MPMTAEEIEKTHQDLLGLEDPDGKSMDERIKEICSLAIASLWIPTVESLPSDYQENVEFIVRKTGSIHIGRYDSEAMADWTDDHGVLFEPSEVSFWRHIGPLPT